MKEIDKVNSQRVSVITVCLNHKEGLDRTLASVVTQSWGDMEHIVIDGGSTDGSVKLLEGHRTDKPYVFVSEPDNGLFDAMNKGWRMADGDLVVFMNAGDTFASETVVETIARAHASETWRWGYGCARICNANSQPLVILSFVPFRLDRLALGLSTVPHQATVMEHELLEELGGFKNEVGPAADQELLLRAALLSQPRLWGEFFADFEGGGVGSSRGWTANVRDMGRFRSSLGLYVGGGRVRDKLVTIALTVYKLGEAGQDKVRRRKGLLGEALFDAR
jgi:glycosyltransferase involved in cell wall biosynthesis